MLPCRISRWWTGRAVSVRPAAARAALCIRRRRGGSCGRRSRRSSPPSPPPGCRSTTPTPTSTCICIRWSAGCSSTPAVRTASPPCEFPPSRPQCCAACGDAPGLGARALEHWTALLRRQARQAGLATNDHAFGIAWSGHMTEARLLRLLPRLPPGLSEIYSHPATHTDATLHKLMPDYEPAAELHALISPAVRSAALTANLVPSTYSEQVLRGPRPLTGFGAKPHAPAR